MCESICKRVVSTAATILAVTPAQALACPVCALVGSGDNTWAYKAMSVMLIVLPLTGPETVTAVEHLVGLTMQVLNSGPPPGGVLSPYIHFSRDQEVSRVSTIDEAGAVSINVDARLQQALEEAVG